MSEPVLTFEALQQALARCMTAHPPAGKELRRHADANSRAGLWGLTSYERTTSVPVADVKPSVLEAFERWSTEGEGA